MKVVVSKCYGGYGLSDEAFLEWVKRTGIPEGGRLEQYGVGCGFPSWHIAYDTPERMGGETWFGCADIPRNDKTLIDIVEEMGEKANTRFSNLCVVEIPDDVEWEIEEYDGFESVEEKHRSW